MKKEFLRHALFLFLFLALLSVVKRWWGLSFWPLWLGGILGIITPEADHLIYVFFISPQEVTSQRVIHLLKNKDFRSALNLLYDTRNERQDLIFHSNLALITFLIF